jgi:hypothetical protein
MVELVMGVAKDVVVYGVPQLGGKAEKREMRSFWSLTGFKLSVENQANKSLRDLHSSTLNRVSGS